MTQRLPMVPQNSDYHKYLREVRKNHQKAVELLKTTRAGAIEMEASGDDGFVQYKAAALSACNHPAVLLIDNDKSFYKQVVDVGYGTKNRIHHINSILDAAINLMNNSTPTPSPSRGAGFVQHISSSAQATAQASVELELNTILTSIEKEIPKYNVGSAENTFLKKVQEKLRATKDIATIVFQIAQLAAASELTADRIHEILSHIMR